MPIYHSYGEAWHHVGFLCLKLLLAVILGGILGWERERHGRPAGLRTHMLLCLGSTLFTIVSLSFKMPGADMTRIPAQIVSGVGFIGAGAILRQGSEIRGLTSATTLWVTAAIGMAVGIGGQFFVVAIIATFISFNTLSVINRLSDRLTHTAAVQEIRLTVAQNADLPSIFGALAELGMSLTSFRQDPGETPGTLNMCLSIRGHTPHDLEQALAKLGTRSDVTSARIEP